MEEMLNSINLTKLREVRVDVELRSILSDIKSSEETTKKHRESIKLLSEQIANFNKTEDKANDIVMIKTGVEPDMVIVAAKSNKDHIYGFEASEIIGRPILDVFFPGEDLRSKIEARIKTIRKLPPSSYDRFQATIAEKSGKMRALRIHLLALSDGFLITTEEK